MRLFVVLIISGLMSLLASMASYAQQHAVPQRTLLAVDAFKRANWQTVDVGIDVLRVITQNGLVMTAYRVSPDQFDLDVVLQNRASGSFAREIGEREGAVLVVNGGFFAQRDNGELYSIGYLRLGGKVFSKGWRSSGGLISFKQSGLDLLPTQAGISHNQNDILQSRPMIIEPGGKWALGSNLGRLKNRTLLCKLKNGDIVFVLVSRAGMSLYEAGWVLRDRQVGGFFGCDAALALDGGSSTQVWYSGNQGLSYPGLSPVHNFIVVRQKEAG